MKPQTLLINYQYLLYLYLTVDLGGKNSNYIDAMFFKNRPITWHLMQPRFYLRFLLLLSKYTSALSENSLILFSHAFNNAPCSSL